MKNKDEWENIWWDGGEMVEDGRWMDFLMVKNDGWKMDMVDGMMDGWKWSNQPSIMPTHYYIHI